MENRSCAEYYVGALNDHNFSSRVNYIDYYSDHSVFILLPFLVVVVFSTVQIIESSFLTPKIVGSRVSINPFVAIIVLFIGVDLWGIDGMILFIPMIVILRVGFSQFKELVPYGYLLGKIIDYRESEREKD